MFLLGLIQRTVNVKLTDTWNISFALQVQSANLSLERKMFLSVASQPVWGNADEIYRFYVVTLGELLAA